MRFIRCLFAMLLFATPAAAATADDELERMLAALGGRDVWAAATGTINDSQQNLAQDPGQVRVVITMDFTRPRFRIDTAWPGGATSGRVIDGDRSWRQTREGAVEDVPADLYADEMKWYGGHVYRSIHRLAARDPALTLKLGEDGRLEVFEGGVRMIWFRLDALGMPYAFGAWDAAPGTISGPWEFAADGMKHPIWVSSADGTWRANVKALTVSPALNDALFQRPSP